MSIFFDKINYSIASPSKSKFLDFAGTQIRTLGKQRECLSAKL